MTDEQEEDFSNSDQEGADNILDLFKKIHDGKLSDILSSEKDRVSSDRVSSQNASHNKPKKVIADNTGKKNNLQLTRVYSFDSIGTITRLARILKNYYNGPNSLYKDEATDTYRLVVAGSGHSPEDFNKICNILSEYGKGEKYSDALGAFMDEHYDAVLKDKALQTFADI